MTEAQKKVREYLAAIGKRGGLASRRELTRSRKTDGRDPRSKTRRAESKRWLANITAGRGHAWAGGRAPRIAENRGHGATANY